MPPNLFEGALARLRAVEPGDAETLQRWERDSITQYRASDIAPPHSLQAMEEMTTAQAGFPENDNLRLAIETLDGHLAGSIGTFNIERRHRRFQYGIQLGRDFQGRGIGGEAVVLLFRYMFEELRYYRGVADVMAYNPASARMHERLGFTLEGRLRRHYFAGGQWHDALFFGITAEEFARVHGRTVISP